MRHLAANNSVNLKTGLGVAQSHWKWRHSIDHIRFSTAPFSMTLKNP